jgi:hypothetical protein
MAKPLTTAGLSLVSVYGSVAEELKQRIGDAQAAQAGPPVALEIEPATDEKRVDAWNARRPEATDAAMQAMATERFAAHRAAGMSPEKAEQATAEDLTHFRYGQRMRLYAHGQVSHADQVKEAKRLSRLAARTTTPEPPAPPPTMPSGALTNATAVAPPPTGQDVPALLSGTAPTPPAPDLTAPSIPPEDGGIPYE